MHRIDADTISQGLLLASQKFGGEVYITGDADFRERAARHAARLGIRVADQDLQGVVEQACEVAQQEREAPRGHKQSQRERDPGIS